MQQCVNHDAGVERQMSHKCGLRSVTSHLSADVLIPSRVSGQIVIPGGVAMVTFSNSGRRADFVHRWLSAFGSGWPVTPVTGLIAFPYVRQATTRMIERA